MSESGPLEILVAQEHLASRVRDALRPLGYAVGVHGSRARDLDLIAVPWVEEAESDRHVIIEALHDAGFEELGMAGVANPHNRLGYALHGVGGDAKVKYVDLSLILPGPQPTDDAGERSEPTQPTLDYAREQRDNLKTKLVCREAELADARDLLRKHGRL